MNKFLDLIKTLSRYHMILVPAGTDRALESAWINPVKCPDGEYVRWDELTALIVDNAPRH